MNTTPIRVQASVVTRGTSALIIAALAVLLATASAHADSLREPVPKDESLMPDGERELLGNHAVELGSLRYRPGKGLAIASEDGKFGLVTRLRLQSRILLQNESGSPAEMGMILRRARLQFVGNSFGKHNKFKAELAFSPKDLRMKAVGSDTFTRETPLLTWYLEFDQLRDLTIRMGQYKIPFSRQRVISSGNLQMVDRSIANGEFNLDRDIGIDIRSKDLLGLGLLKYAIGIYNGEGRSASDYADSDLMYLARLEILPFGMFKDYSEADFQRLAQPGLAIGIGYAYAKNARGTKVNRNGVPADGGTTDFQSLTADMTFKLQGLSLSTELMWRKGTRNPGGAVDDMGLLIPVQDARDGIGWFAQAGYLLPHRPIEVAARFGQLRAADESSIGDKNELGVATSYYFAGHPFKLQADAFQLWSGAFDKGVTRVRLQLQLAF